MEMSSPGSFNGTSLRTQYLQRHPFQNDGAKSSALRKQHGRTAGFLPPQRQSVALVADKIPQDPNIVRRIGQSAIFGSVGGEFVSAAS
jgi:hypothetical protein